MNRRGKKPVARLVRRKGRLWFEGTRSPSHRVALMIKVGSRFMQLVTVDPKRHGRGLLKFMVEDIIYGDMTVQVYGQSPTAFHIMRLKR